MNMEMMDYERAVNELKNQVEIKTNEANAAVQGYLNYLFIKAYHLNHTKISLSILRWLYEFYLLTF